MVLAATKFKTLLYLTNYNKTYYTNQYFIGIKDHKQIKTFLRLDWKSMTQKWDTCRKWNNFLRLCFETAWIWQIIKRYLFFKTILLCNYENYDYDVGYVIAHLRVHIFLYMSFGVYQNNIYRHCPMSSARISQMKRLYFFA